MDTTCSETTLLSPDTTEAPAAVVERPSARMCRPPDWRYHAAVDYLRAISAGDVPEIPDDPVVQLLVRAMRPRTAHPRRQRARRQLVSQLWPAVDDVLYLGTDGRRSARTAEIEVCLMKGWTHDEAVLAGCSFDRKVYELYAKSFFDLTGARSAQAWINDFLFSPETWAKDKSLLRSRLLAFHGDGTTGIRSAVMGSLTDSEAKLLRKIQGNERQKRIFDYVVGRTGIEPGLYASLMESALKGADDHAFQEKMKDREDAGSGSLEELAQHMEEGIRAFSQHELQSAETDGLDFVNQYTNTLTRNDNDGKKDI